MSRCSLGHRHRHRRVRRPGLAPGRRRGIRVAGRGSRLADRLRLRHVQRAGPGGDGRLVAGVAVRRRRRLHRRQQPALHPARAHRGLGQEAAADRLARPARSRSARRPAARATPTGCRRTWPRPTKQGKAEAGKAIANAKGLGIGRGSTLYYDLEDYDIAPDDCRRAALSFLSGWTKTLHAKGYGSGVYSNIAAAIELPRLRGLRLAGLLRDARRHLVRLGERQGEHRHDRPRSTAAAGTPTPGSTSTTST